MAVIIFTGKEPAFNFVQLIKAGDGRLIIEAFKLEEGVGNFRICFVIEK